MFSTETLLTIIAILGALRTLLGLAHYFKLDALLAAQMDKLAAQIIAKAKATEDPSDDGVAEAEAAIIKGAAQMIRDNKGADAIDLLERLARMKGGK